MKQHIFKIILFLILPLSISSTAYSQGLTKIVTYDEDGVSSKPIYILNSDNNTQVNYTSMYELEKADKKSSFKFDASLRHAVTIDIGANLYNYNDGGVYVSNSHIYSAISATIGSLYLGLGSEYLDIGYSRTAYFGNHLYLQGIVALSICEEGYLYFMPRVGIELKFISIWTGISIDKYFINGESSLAAVGVSFRL